MVELESQTLSIKEQCTQLNESTKHLRDVSIKMQEATKPVVAIEKQLDEAGKQLGDMTDDPFFRMEYSEFAKYIDKAINAHKSWLENLKKMVDNRTSEPIQFDAHKCGFGHFYYSMTPKTPELREIWVKVEAKHNKFHECGKYVKDAIMKEDYDTAQKRYNEAEDISRDLLAEFKKMEDIALSKNGK